MWTLPAIGFAVYCVAYAISDAVSARTKGLISSVLCLSLLYLAAFLTGILPKDTIAVTGIPTMLGAFGTLFMITNIGTLIRLRDFCREWKTVLICLCGVGALAVFSLATAGLFDRIYALCAIPSIAGGIVALLVMQDALAVCTEQYVAFTMLCYSIHSFIGLPAAAFMLRKYCGTDPSGRSFLPPPAAESSRRLRFFPVSEKSPPSALMARLALVCAAATILSQLMGERVPTALIGLLLGIAATELGFLANSTLQKCGYYDFIMFLVVSGIIDPLSAVTLDALRMCLAPLLFYMLGGCLVIMLGGIAAGMLLKVDWRLSCALSCGCLLGFPATLITAEDVVDNMDFPAETHAAVRDALSLKMVIAGFATVSTSSVVISTLIAPLLMQG